jgi:hypothetical protein
MLGAAVSKSATNPFDAFANRLAACVRLLASDRGGEVAAALASIQRMLTSGIDLHAIAERIETPPGLNESTKQEIRRAVEDARASGYAEGIKAAENKQHGADAFRSTGSAEWIRVALFVQREKHRLPPQHHQFVDDMAARTMWEREPTEKQHRYLHSLFLKLGGKIT